MMPFNNLCHNCRVILKQLHRRLHGTKDFHFLSSIHNNNNSQRKRVNLQIIFFPTARKSSEVKEQQDNSFFITTPIFYVNAAPHIGHLHTAVLADAVQRWKTLNGSHTIFSTGTDEHGLKVQHAAGKAGVEPGVFCDQVSQKFQNLFREANIGTTDFIRTTEERHERAVSKFWKTLVDNDHIYKGLYEGWYCTSDEAFLTESQVTSLVDKDGVTTKISSESGQPVEWMTEENYMFKLSKFGSHLTDWINRGVIFPSKFESLVRSWLADGLPDLSVSRQRDRLQWGISVPGDHSQTIYVWLDALVNYLTVAGYPYGGFHWPPDCHVIGKDILKFHAVYWPAFLMAAGLEPPKRIVCHSHWTVNNEKMSKSRGNVVDPVERIQMFSADGMRYFLLKESVPHSDGNYTDEKVMQVINSDLVNTLGNLLQRCTSLSVNPDQVIPPLHGESFSNHFTQEEIDRYDRLLTLQERVDVHYSDFNIDKGLDIVMSELRWANGLIQHHKPWELVKSTDQKQYLEALLHIAMETLVVCGIVLQPIIPDMADKLLTRLGVPMKNRTCTGENVWLRKMRNCGTPHSLGEQDGVLMRRLDQKVLQGRKKT
ncbi:methionine--tRNA ligase, mitochondrial-like [Liolophura sinensis]|uniref:methionine--tRNA ligase, mitochondrial-like n=1 Tax=Liolophura sinensis TaxID=3198878 RepID=UPI0031589A91